MPITIRVTIDSRLRFPADTPSGLIKLLKQSTTHTNPEYQKKRALGIWVGNVPTKISTWREEGGFSLPRGATKRVRQIAAGLGVHVVWVDRRIHEPADWAPFGATPRWYQEAGIAACVKAEQGIVRAPTGCLAGNAMIEVSHRGRDFEMPIEELVRYAREQTSSAPPIRVHSRGRDGRLVYTQLIGAYESGEKLTYRVETYYGHKLRATAEHRFLVLIGAAYEWTRLDHIRPGMSVCVHDSLHGDATTPSEVVAIERYRVEPTYDLSLFAPNNYLANEIVVHNSGKTFMALASLPQFGQRSLVIVRDRNLLDQWVEQASRYLSLAPKEIGIVQGAKRRIGERLTLALQQTLYSKTFPMAEFCSRFGAILVDEVHDAAARTVGETVDAFPGRVRIGFSADHTRRDRKEFLIEDLFGEVIYEVGKKNLERTGAVVPVIVRLVPTDFKADWYAKAPPEERNFTRLVSEMIEDEERCLIVRRVIQELVAAGTVPALVFTRRREHASRLAERELPADGIPSGLLLGSEGNSEQFEESKRLLLKGVLKVAVGTFNAVGQGIDIPNVMAGVCATPIGGNRQFFGQVRGRICRVVPGKKVGHLYYLWDHLVFPDSARNMCNWNDGLVEVYDRQRKEWVSFR